MAGGLDEEAARAPFEGKRTSETLARSSLDFWSLPPRVRRGNEKESRIREWQQDSQSGYAAAIPAMTRFEYACRQ
jgi:hypothetical protein